MYLGDFKVHQISISEICFANNNFLTVHGQEKLIVLFTMIKQAILEFILCNDLYFSNDNEFSLRVLIIHDVYKDVTWSNYWKSYVQYSLIFFRGYVLGDKLP